MIPSLWFPDSIASGDSIGNPMWLIKRPVLLASCPTGQAGIQKYLPKGCLWQKNQGLIKISGFLRIGLLTRYKPHLHTGQRLLLYRLLQASPAILPLKTCEIFIRPVPKTFSKWFLCLTLLHPRLTSRAVRGEDMKNEKIACRDRPDEAGASSEHIV